MLHLLTALTWLVLAAGIARLLWSQRGRLRLGEANEPGDFSCYRWAFYLNPNDARLFVRDLTGIGWTVNLAHRAAVGILIAAAGAPFVLLFLFTALRS